MTKNYIAAAVLSALCLPGYASDTFEVNVLKKGTLSCHNDTVYNSKGKPINCEVSGVVFINDMLYFTTDWWDNNNNNFFAYKWDGHNDISGAAEEIKQATINSARKIEDMTLSHDGKYIFSTSAFSYGPLWNEIWKPMNRLLYWPANDPQRAKTLNFTPPPNEVPDEALLRSKIFNGIKSRYPDAEYIHVESLATLPNNRLIIATRQMGTNPDQYNTRSILLSVSYNTSESGNLYLTGNFEVIAELDFHHPRLSLNYSLSSLEYDSGSKALYALATYENSDSSVFSTTIWRISSKDDFTSNRLTAELATNCEGHPVLLPHKLEDFSQINGGRYIAVADDDRTVTTSDGTRKPYEAFYYIFDVKPSAAMDNYCFSAPVNP